MGDLGEGKDFFIGKRLDLACLFRVLTKWLRMYQVPSLYLVLNYGGISVFLAIGDLILALF